MTVGAFTERVFINPEKYPGWVPLAPAGGLSPCSTTSSIWGKKWPYKPDVVVEGGNMARHPDYEQPDYLDSLLLLSTNALWQNKLLVSTGDTSGATAIASGMCARIYSEYPELWPETVRGLLIHSAKWTAEMLGYRTIWEVPRSEIEKMLKVYGYGVPNLDTAIHSAHNSLTLIAQEYLTPYLKDDDGAIKTNELHLHKLPWPKDALLQLGDAEVEMRVTLSYFIEPKPERKSFSTKYRYASHGLRFDMKSATENPLQFSGRINRMARAAPKNFKSTPGDSDEWLMGSDLRTRGSIHSDYWSGTAADLAEKDYVAIFPVKGWWSESPYLQKWHNRVQYSLIVTIDSPEQDVDIYTPVANIILV